MRMTSTIADVFRPCDRARGMIFDAIIVICGSLLVGLSAQIKIYLPFGPVPVTGQTFAVLILGALLGSRRGALTMIAYIAEGATGLPVFACGIGPAVLIGPTGGFLIGFIAAAYAVGKLAEFGWDRKISAAIAAMFVGEAILYFFGVCWLAILTNTRTALMTGLYPFIVGDILKVALAAAVLPAGWKLLNYLKIKSN